MTPVKVESAGEALIATLADVENRNALGAPLLRALRDALATANSDPAVRALVLTNEGATFCAGADLKPRAITTGASDTSPKADGLERLLDEIQTSPKPVIARIAGHAVGGGVGLAAACDISIAADDAMFGFSEVRLGVAPAIISVVCLPKMRAGDAMEVFLRGHRFSAARAVELGLINRAVPAARLDAAVDEVLADLRLGGPGALGHAKRLVHDVPKMATRDAFAWAAKRSEELFASEEAAEGVAAFLEKRAPRWATRDDE